jgi:hypothetical protein
VLSELVIAFVDPQVLEQLSFALEQFFDCFKQKRFTESPWSGQEATIEFVNIEHPVDIFCLVSIKKITFNNIAK